MRITLEKVTVIPITYTPQFKLYEVRDGKFVCRHINSETYICCTEIDPECACHGLPEINCNDCDNRDVFPGDVVGEE